MKRFRARLALILALVLIGAGGSTPAWAGDDDHEEARRAVQSGQALPLAEILQRLDDRLGGDIIEVEFEREDDRYVYEFTVITPSGRLLEIYVDALSAAIVEIDD